MPKRTEPIGDSLYRIDREMFTSHDIEATRKKIALRARRQAAFLRVRQLEAELEQEGWT